MLDLEESGIDMIKTHCKKVKELAKISFRLKIMFLDNVTQVHTTQ